MDSLKTHFERDRVAQQFGMEIVSIGDGSAVVRMPVQEIHKNSIGTVHGGALFSLADYAFAISGNSHGHVAVALDASISFIRATTDGVLTATAREVARNRKIGNHIVEIADESGELVALFKGTVYNKRDSLPLPSDD